MRSLFRWLLTSQDERCVSPWNPVIADRHAEATERMLLGAAGRACVTGNRRTEAIIAEREHRAAEMEARWRHARMRRVG